MKLKISTHEKNLGGNLSLAKKFYSPLCGIGTRFGAFISGENEADVMSVGGQISGVHYLLDRNPPKNSYHIGGSGIYQFEAIVKTVAESIERYCQLMAGVNFKNEIRWTTFNQLEAEDENVINIDKLIFFEEKQYKTQGFPFDQFDKNSPIGFIKVKSFFSSNETWLPAQLLFIGYNVRKWENEPWITPAVTTGTATHVDKIKCLKNAILELNQLDSTMGHWYGSINSIRIELDDRVKNLKSILNKVLPSNSYKPNFYLLPNPDLIGFTVACLIENEFSAPHAVVGLGSDLSLESSMYKSFIEATSCYQLGKFVTFQEFYKSSGTKNIPDLDCLAINDLDRNIFYYSLKNNVKKLKERFDEGTSLKASLIGEDIDGNDFKQLQLLVKNYRDSGKELYFMDITSPDVSSLNFFTFRVWSPDTLSLSIPNCPNLAHKRYNSYNGIQHEDIHPYP